MWLQRGLADFTVLSGTSAPFNILLGKLRIRRFGRRSKNDIYIRLRGKAPACGSSMLAVGK